MKTSKNYSQKINKIICLLINKGFSSERIPSIIDRFEGLGVKEKNRFFKKLNRLKDTGQKEGFSLPMNTWKQETKFQQIFDTKANPQRYWLYTSGRGGGKSFDMNETIVKMTFEKGVGILFARYYATSVMTSIAPAFLNASERLGIREHFYVTSDKIVNKLTGSFIYLTGLHQTGGASSGLKSLEGVNTVFIEEAEDLDSEKAWNSFNKLDDSVRTTEKTNRVVLVLNPKSKNGQVYQNFIKNNHKTIMVQGERVQVSNRADVKHIHISFHKIKEHLNPSWLYKEKVCYHRAYKGIDIETGRELKDEEQKIALEFYRNNYLGIFNGYVKGRVFPHYEKQEDFPAGIPSAYGMDFGYSHVDALIKVGLSVREKKIYLKQCIFENGLSEGALAKKIMEQTPHDAQIWADSAEPRLISDLRRATNRAISPVIKQQVASQIQQMLDFTLVVCGEADGIERELGAYRWSDKLDSKGRAVPNKADDMDNSIDAIRYALTILLKDYDEIGKEIAGEDPKGKAETEVQRKQRLFREALARKKKLRAG